MRTIVRTDTNEFFDGFSLDQAGVGVPDWRFDSARSFATLEEAAGAKAKIEEYYKTAGLPCPPLTSQPIIH